MGASRQEVGIVATTALAAGFAIGSFPSAENFYAWLAMALIVAIFLWTFLRVTRRAGSD